MQTTPLKSALSKPSLSPATKTPVVEPDDANTNELLSWISGPQDLVEIRTPSPTENRVQAARTVLFSRSTAQVALSLAGAAVGGLIGLAGAAVINGITSFVEADKDRLKSGAFNGLATAVAGAAGLIPGGFGALAVAGVAAGSAKLIAQGDAPEKISNLKLDEFAPRYLSKVRSQLKSPHTLSTPDFVGLSPQKAEKVAAQAVTSALEVCCRQLSPRLAVALARDTAKEMVTPFSVEEFRYERMISPSDTKLIGENVFLAEIGTATPAAASTQKAFLSPSAPKKYSNNALAVMVGHEMSHVDNRDMVGNLGGLTLKTALRLEGNSSWNPLDWLRSGSMEKKIDLAVAEISRETEYRCDQEGARKLLDLGAESSVVSEAFREIFSPEKGSSRPLAAHPLPQDRIAAVESYLQTVNPAPSPA